MHWVFALRGLLDHKFVLVQLYANWEIFSFKAHSFSAHSQLTDVNYVSSSGPLCFLLHVLLAFWNVTG